MSYGYKGTKKKTEFQKTLMEILQKVMEYFLKLVTLLNREMERRLARYLTATFLPAWMRRPLVVLLALRPCRS